MVLSEYKKDMNSINITITGAGLFIAIYVFLCLPIPNSAPLCGFWAPGRSSLWKQQMARTFYHKTSNATHWHTYPSGPVLDLISFDEALRQLDAGNTSALQLDNIEYEAHRLQLHAHMIPYVVRSFAGMQRSMLTTETLLRDLQDLRGSAKRIIKDYVGEYFGNSEMLNVSLKEYLDRHSLNHWNVTDRRYWVACHGQDDDNPQSHNLRFDNHKAWLWLKRASRVLATHLLPGIRASGRLCVRVTTSSARVPMHIDTKHNMLFQVHGTRRVIIAMPDMGYAMYPRQMTRNTNSNVTCSAENRSAFVATVDPRYINYTRYPRARQGRVLAVTLHAGDALYIPISWWHYVETEISDIESLSIAVNVFSNAYHIEGASSSKARQFHAHPCNPREWSLQQHLRYNVLETWFGLRHQLSELEAIL